MFYSLKRHEQVIVKLRYSTCKHFLLTTKGDSLCIIN